MRRLPHAIVVTLLLGGIVAPRGSFAADAAPTEIWLREGAGLSVSATPGGERLVFGLVGRAWSLNPQDGFADQLTVDEEIARRPVLSPDGTLIAYETKRGGFYQIMVRNADGTGPRQITFGAVHHRSPSWSRSGPQRPFDGNRLIMSSNRGGRYGIWEIDVDTLALQQLTFAKLDEREPAWNESGTRIAYVAETPDGTALYAVTPGAQPELLLQEQAQIRAPAWRPGGGLLTYVRQSNGESQLRMLLLSQPAITKPITQAEDVFPFPAVWLDRSRFLYTSDGQIRRRRFGERTADTISFNARVEVINEAEQTRRLAVDASGNRPVLGHNGTSVAVDGRFVVATLGDLWEFRPDGTLLRQLTNDPYVDAQPALSPDATRVVFVSDRDGSLQIWLTDLATMRTRRLTHEQGVAVEPRWDADGAAIEYLAAPHPGVDQVVRKRVTIEEGDVEIIDNAVETGDVEIIDTTVAAAAGDATADAAIPLTWRTFVGVGRKIIRAGRVFDGIGPGYLTEQEIVIDGDRITAIRPWDSGNDTEEAAAVVDARDQTILPGLIDMSVRQSPLGDERLGRKYLAYGITTVREAVIYPAAALEQQESWASGRRVGPRVLMTSTPCTETTGEFVVRPVLEPALAQREFRERINAAVDQGSVAIGVCPTLSVTSRIDLIATVHARGLPAMTGTVFPDVLLGADETRPPSPELAGYSDFALVTGTLGTTVTSNLAAYGLPLLVGDGELITGWQYRQLFSAAEHDWYARTWDLSEHRLAELRIRSAALSRSLTAAAALGARVVAGSGAPTVPPGLGLHAELRLLTAAGLQPFQVLRMATLDAARALGAGDQLGVIQPGAIADLIIVDGDPLSEIRDVARISMTISSGRPYTRLELGAAGNRPTTVGNLYNP